MLRALACSLLIGVAHGNEDVLMLLQAHAEAVHGEGYSLVNFNRQKNSGRIIEVAANKEMIPTVPPVIGTGAPSSAAEASGVQGNGPLDGYAFITATITNSIMICIFVGIFMKLRHIYPRKYRENLKWDESGKYIGFAPTKALGGNADSSNKDEIEQNLDETWGWWTASLGSTTDEIADGAGLDLAMLLEFCNLGMSMLGKIGLPMMLIIGPMNCAFGGQPAWAIGDYLSSLSFGNVENGSWLYWVHAFVVWYVVIIVQSSLYNAQKNFLEHRFKWLHRMAEKRANTILVEGIPDDYRKEGKLEEFFGKIFGRENIAATYALRDNSVLDDLVETHKDAMKHLDEANAKWAAAKEAKPDDEQEDLKPKDMMGNDLIRVWSAKANEAKRNIDAHKKEIEDRRALPPAEEEEDSGYFSTGEKCEAGDICWSGFVTFKERKYAQMAVNQLYAEDKDTWVVSSPPEPMDIIWKDLMLSPKRGLAGAVIGYALIAAVAWAYLPIVIGIAKLAVSVDMGPLEAVWIGLAPTLGLQIMVAMLPTILLLIFRSFWLLKAGTLAQKKLQTYYFWFQVVFVVLVTAVGSDATNFVLTVFTDPLALPDLLGATMPPATHFYMNFLVLQWVTHAQQMMRHVMLIKYLGFQQLYPDDDDMAFKLSEPEDQDYYGMGSRSARFTINMVIGVVYGTLCPPMNVLCWVNFYICRLVYGYLIPFAETKKPDLGGPFWVDQLSHLFVANILYCIVMCGVLSTRAEMTGFQPVTIAAPSLIYVLYSYRRFDRAFSWEELPLPAVLEVPEQHKGKQRHLDGEYIQETYEAKEVPEEAVTEEDNKVPVQR